MATLTETRPTLLPIGAALVGAVTISFSAIFFQLSGASPITGTFFRMAYALPPLAALWWLRRGRDERTSTERWMAVAAGVFLTADVALWHTAIGFIGTGLATLIANSQVVIVPLVTWALFRERPSNAALGAMPVVMVGLALITGLGRGDTFGSRPVLGVVLAVGAAVLYSGFLIGYRRSNRRLAPAAGSLFDASLGGAAAALVIGVLLGDLDLAPSWPAHGWLLALAWGAQVTGWLLIGYALPRLPAAHTSFAILLQPTMTLVWGRLIFDEGGSWVQGMGVLAVLAGILWVTLKGRHASLRQPPPA